MRRLGHDPLGNLHARRWGQHWRIALDGGRHTKALALVAAGALLVLYAFSGTVLPGETDLLRFSSGLFDMDVARVVADWTTADAAWRVNVHPLVKLAVTPLGAALRGDGDAVAGLRAAQLLAMSALTLNAVLAGVLAFQLAGRQRVPGWVAGLLCGVSFSSLLLASVPESTSLSCIATLTPLVFLNARSSRPFTWAESAAWAALGVLGIAFTVTQVVHWAIALGARLVFLPQESGRRARPRALAAVAGAAVLTLGATALQSSLFPAAPRFYEADLLASERPWLRHERLAKQPIRHVSGVLAHFLVYDFAPPFPGFSDHLIRLHPETRPRLRYWSLSIEEATRESWHPAQMALAGALALLLAPALSALTSADRRYRPALLCLASQLGLHLLYGREYVIYSANWHGLLVAVLVAASWERFPRARRALPLVAAALAAALLANGLAVLDRAYTELGAGLERGRRDEAGRLLPLLRETGLQVRGG